MEQKKGRSPYPDIHAIDNPGGLSVDILHRRMQAGEKSIPLSADESALLYILLQHSGKTVSKDALCREAEADWSDRALVSLVYRLRKKLTGSGYSIRVQRGQGYVLEQENLSGPHGAATLHEEEV